MSSRLHALSAALVVGLSLAFVAPIGVQAQSSSDGWEDRDGRSYIEPGVPYDPNQHGDSNYDSGYNALRNNGSQSSGGQGYEQEANSPDADRGYDDRYAQPNAPAQPSYPKPAYQPQPSYRDQEYRRDGYRPPASSGPGQAYAPPSAADRDYDEARDRPAGPPREPGVYEDTFSDNEIVDAGHRFFGKTTTGLAKVIAHVFQRSGRPNAYILGEEGGGALIAGLRYGEGTLYAKWGDQAKIYWQGPSIGYDFGANGAKTMILVYNLKNVDDIYHRFAGVDGSAYFVGGVGVTYQKRGRVVLAPITTGVGLRLGANVGYLKYSREPTWNPF